MEESLFKSLKLEDSYIVGLLLSLALMFVLPAFISIVVTSIYSLSIPDLIQWIQNNDSQADKYVLEISFISQFIGYLGIVMFFIFKFKNIFVNDFNSLKEGLLKNILIIVISFVSMYLLTEIVNKIFDAFNIPTSSENQDLIVEALFSNISIIIIILVVFIAPFVEEVVFRKLLYGSLEKRFNIKKWIVILISTFIFSLIHISSELSSVFMEGQNPLYLLSIILYLPLSFVLSFAYSYSNNNIYVAIIIHMFNNLLSVVMILYGI